MGKRLDKGTIAVLAAAIVVLGAMAYFLSIAHERRMTKVTSEAFFAGNANPNPSAVHPAQAVQARKAAAYLAVGLAFFFSSNREVGGGSAALYRVFFPPTQDDLACDFTVVGSPGGVCAALVDDISCVDRTINIPVNHLDPVGGPPEPSDPTDCRINVFDGVYAFSKSTLLARARVVLPQPTGAGGQGAVLLALPRGSFSTRLVMLLRPSFVRSGSSRLYWVDYGAPGTDAASYDSWDATAGRNAVLRLVPVLDRTIDRQQGGASPSSNSIAAVVNPPARNPFGASSSQTASTPEKGARDMIIPGSAPRVSLTFYYLSYVEPNQMVPVGQPTPVATAYMRVMPNAKQVVLDASGAAVLTVQAGGALSEQLSISVAGQTFSMPALQTGVAAVTATHDAVIACCSSQQRTSVRRFALSRPLQPYVPAPSANGAEASPDVLKALGPRYSTASTSAIPCVADVMLRTAALSPSTLAVAEVPRPDSDKLVATSPLMPGQHLLSPSGAFRADYQWDGVLAIYNVQTALPAWAISTTRSAMQPGARAGRLSIGRDDGVLRAYDSSVPQTRPYWVSSKSAAPADQAPYSAHLTDQGVLVVQGALGAAPVWASGAGNYGFLLG